MWDGLSAALGSPNHWNFWEKKVKRISKYVLDVLFKHTFHICPPIKYKTVQVVDFCFSHRNFTDSKGWPKSVHYIQGIWLIKVHPGSSFFPLSFAQIWILLQAELHRRNSKKGSFFALVIQNCNYPIWISVSFERADSQLAVPCFEFYIFTYCISDKLTLLRARWNLPNVITFCICSCGWWRDNCRSGCFTLGTFMS